MSKSSRLYLGDSVYADYMDCHVVLTTESSAYPFPSNTIYLDRNVAHHLKKYIDNVFKENENDQPHPTA